MSDFSIRYYDKSGSILAPMDGLEKEISGKKGYFSPFSYEGS